VLKLLQPNITLRIGGAGNKCVQILDDQADFLIHTVKSMKFWDMCAAEALMKARFGIITDKDRN
jgi:3'(2'), 5'-bisphosphate nucleotidase